MAEEPVMDTLRTVIRQTFGVDDDVPIDRETVSYDIDGWDSLSHSTLLIMVEKTFKISITSEEGESLDDVGALADLVVAKAG